MARNKNSDFFSSLRSQGIRKRVARALDDLESGGRDARGSAEKLARRAINDLRTAADAIEKRLDATVGAGKRNNSATKATSTRGTAAKRTRAATKTRTSTATKKRTGTATKKRTATAAKQSPSKRARKAPTASKKATRAAGAARKATGARSSTPRKSS